MQLILFCHCTVYVKDHMIVYFFQLFQELLDANYTNQVFALKIHFYKVLLIILLNSRTSRTHSLEKINFV